MKPWTKSSWFMPVVNLLTTLFFLFVRVHLPSLAFFLLSNRIYTCTSVHVILTTWFCRYHWNPAKTYILKFFEGLTLLNNYYQRTYHIDYWIAALYVRKKRKSLRLLVLYIVAPKFYVIDFRGSSVREVKTFHLVLTMDYQPFLLFFETVSTLELHILIQYS